MLADRYGLALSITSSAARDAYVEGCELALTLYPGALEAFDAPSPPIPVSPWPMPERPRY